MLPKRLQLQGIAIDIAKKSSMVQHDRKKNSSQTAKTESIRPENYNCTKG
jgi:hypothetical protein